MSTGFPDQQSLRRHHHRHIALKRKTELESHFSQVRHVQAVPYEVNCPNDYCDLKEGAE
jgi:hypothetical protein